MMAGAAMAQVQYGAGAWNIGQDDNVNSSVLIHQNTVLNGNHPSHSWIASAGWFTLHSGTINNVDLRNGWTNAGGPNVPAVASLVKTTNGVVHLIGESSYTGTTTIDQGTLVLGNGVQTGDLTGTSAITINSDGMLLINYGNNNFSAAPGTITNNGVFAITNGAGETTAINSTNITGSGILRTTGPGTAVIGAGSFISATGGTEINSGTLRVGAGGELATSSIDVGETSSADIAHLDVRGGIATASAGVRLRVDGATVTVTNGGLLNGNVTSSAGVENNDITVDGLDSQLNGNVSINTGMVTVSNDGGINGNVDIHEEGDVDLIGGSIVGNVTLHETGEVHLSNGSSIEGRISIGEGGAFVSDSSVQGNVQVGQGGVVVVNDGWIEGDINVGLGGVSVASGGEIIGDVVVGAGLVSVVGNGGSGVWDDTQINGNVEILGEGDVVLSSRAVINGNVTVTDNISLDESRIAGKATTEFGDINIANGSTVYGGAEITNEGIVRVQGGSLLLNGARVQEGAIVVDTGSVANGTLQVVDGVVDPVSNRQIAVVVDGAGSEVNGNIIVTNGDVIFDNAATAVGSVNVTTGDVVANRGSYVNGPVTVATGDVNLDSSIIDGGVSINVAGNLTLNNNSEVWEDININDGYVYLDGNSAIRRADPSNRVKVDLGFVKATDGSTIESNIEVANAGPGANAVELDAGASVLGDIEVTYGDVDIKDNGTSVTGDISLFEGDLFVYNQASVTGDVSIDYGSAIVAARGLITGDVTIEEEGDVALDRGAIEGNVAVKHGNVSLDVESSIEGNVSVERGNITLNHQSLITGDFVQISEIGNVALTDDSLIEADVFVNQGNVLVDIQSAIIGDVHVVEGDTLVDNGSSITGDVHVGEGNTLVDNESAIIGDVHVGEGSTLVDNESAIIGDVHVVEGNTLVDNGSSIIGDVHVVEGNTLVDNESSIVGSVLTELGDIDVLGGSAITGASVEALVGNINVLDESAINAHVTINDGWLTVDENSAINGRVDVNGLAVADIEGVVNGNVYLNDATSNGDHGGVLFGNPLINGDLINNGWLTPGRPDAPVGTVRVTGDYTQLENGTYQVDIFSLRDHDRLLVAGTANIDGNLYVTNHGVKVYRNQDWRLIEAGALNVVDEFDVQHNFAINTMLTPHVHYGERYVSLHIHQEKFAELKGLNHNQHQVARAVDAAAKKDQLDPLFEHLNYTDRSNVPGLLSRLSPEELTAIFNIGVATAQIQNVNIERRLEDVRAGSYGFSQNGLALTNGSGTVTFDQAAVASTKDGLTLAGWDGKSIVSKEVVAPVYEVSRWGFFATGTGEWARVSSTSEARGQDFTSAGVTVGADYRVSENFVVGVNGGYTNTQSDLEWDGSIDVNGGRGGIYASVFGGGAYANLALGGGYNSYDTSRGTLGGMAKGSTDGAEANGLFGIGYDFRVGCLAIGPVASVQYTYIGLNEFTESGSDASLHFKDQHQHSLRTTVGAKASYAINLGSVVIRPEVRAQWKHEYLDSTPAISARFNGADHVFTVNGPHIGRDSVLIDAGASVEFNAGFSVYAYYTGELGRTNYESNAVNGGFRVAF